jgi:hypothetical protein
MPLAPDIEAQIYLGVVLADMEREVESVVGLLGLLALVSVGLQKRLDAGKHKVSESLLRIAIGDTLVEE